MTEANTFDAGILASSRLRAFLRFEHSYKSWKAGQFTADVVLLKGEAAPIKLGRQFSPKEGLPTDEGIYRLGGILSNRDKWWYLRDYDGKLSRSGDQWFAKKYDHTARVIADAVTNVTSDVVAVLKKLEAVPKPKP